MSSNPTFHICNKAFFGFFIWLVGLNGVAFLVEQGVDHNRQFIDLFIANQSIDKLTIQT
jgi:hypothetical protein